MPIENLSAEPDGREIGPEDRKLLVGVLQSFVGRTASVVVNASDPETSAYAREIVGVLKDAGWQVPPSYGTMFTPIILPGHDSVSPGVVLGFSPEVPAGQSSEILQAFREGGVDAGIGPHFPGSDHPITILVGPAK